MSHFHEEEARSSHERLTRVEIERVRRDRPVVSCLFCCCCYCEIRSAGARQHSTCLRASWKHVHGDIHMYADDTTIYVIGPTPDAVTTKLNTILSKVHDWCCLNLLTPHPEKTEFLLLGSRTFVGPMQAIRFGQCIVTQVESSRCLGLEIDCHLKWHKHVTELTKLFSQKLSLTQIIIFFTCESQAGFVF